MQWFEDAKLGIFIHYGIYAVNGIPESWSFYNGQISYADYMKQLDGFTASNYNPETWAELFAEAGAKYAVLTSKHHDGVALWDTKLSELCVVQKTPAKRDLLTPYANALRKNGLKVGIYFSHLDWSHPNYATVYNGPQKASNHSNPFDYPKGEVDLDKWNSFVAFRNGQLKELDELVKPDLWWFDGGWEHNAIEWDAKEIREMLLKKNPRTIINERLTDNGDYSTPEQNFPITRPQEKYWELCLTTNDNWGFQHRDHHWKTPKEIITIFADVISNGGNLLLDIGPMEDGTIPKEQEGILKELGRWNHQHGEAIFGTIPGLRNGHFYGPSTMSKDSTCLYLFLPGNARGPIEVKGILNDVMTAEVLGTHKSCATKIVGKISWSAKPGLLFIEVPQEEKWLDPMMTVIKLTFEKPLKIYSGSGGL